MRDQLSVGTYSVRHSVLLVVIWEVKSGSLAEQKILHAGWGTDGVRKTGGACLRSRFNAFPTVEKIVNENKVLILCAL